MFEPSSLLQSEWYASYTAKRHADEIHLWERHLAYLESFLQKSTHADEATRLGIPGRLDIARKTLSGLKG